MTTPQIGIYGLGTMGSALALNMADNGIFIGVANRSADRTADFVAQSGTLASNIDGFHTLEALIAALPSPRLLLAMIPSTGPMDDFLDGVMPLLDGGDTVIDAGNADFHATRRRSAVMAERGLNFVGLGVSGGEEGARNGPSMMMGGAIESWTRLRPILTAIAAQFDGSPCVEHLGPDGAGHFVKTVHNGIEYADMQMLAEVYDLMRFGAGKTPVQVADAMDRWNEGPLQSYLTEITAKVLRYDDPETGQPMVDVIKDSAGQKGTGRWTVIEAVRLGQSATMIEGAVAGRAWSAESGLRRTSAQVFGDMRQSFDIDEAELEQAMRAARVLGYAQGFRILAAASDEFEWSLDFARIAEIWRAGCIIRAAMLDDISEAFREGPPHGQLHLSPRFSEALATGIPALRRIVGQAIAAGYALPVLNAALTMYDTMRQGRGTACLIQAQRDFFGYHGFERVDAKGGGFHGPWWD